MRVPGDSMIIAAMAVALAQAATPPASPPTATTFEKLPTPKEAVPVGSRVTRGADHATADEQFAAWTMHRFAECLVRTRERQMLELLSTGLNSPEQNRIVRDIIGWRSRCLRARSMRVDHILLRGAVAEAFYRQELRGRAVGSLDRAPALLDADPSRNIAAALERLGRCMATRRPEVVRAVIGTRPGSPRESAALAGIVAALPDCLPQPPAAARHPLLLRGAVAEAFYLHRHGLLDGAPEAESSSSASEQVADRLQPTD